MKAMRKNMQKGNTEFELFDLQKDRGETTNIAFSHPEVIQKVQEIIKNEHRKSPNKRWEIKVLDN